MSDMFDRVARQERALKVRHRIADRYLNGDEATAEQVFDALPYSAIPDWHDVEQVLEVLSLAGLLATPERDATVAAKALREAATDAAYGIDWDDVPESVESWLHDRADRIEREAGESGADT